MSQSTTLTETAVNPFYERAYGLSDVENARKLYDEWAHRYDNDTVNDGYTGPQSTVEAIVYALGSDKMRTATFLDAGCGTGLVGVLLAKEGATTIDGIDLSPGMLKVARRTTVFRSLEEADLTKPMQKSDDSYDVIACVGTLTCGHVGPQVLSEFARVVKPGGLVAVTVHEKIWEDGGYRAEADQLESSGRVEIVRLEKIGYRVGANVGAKLLVMKRT